MSDLQCPATFHVLGPEADCPRTDLVHGAPIAAVHAGPRRASAAVGEAVPDPLPGPEGAGLLDVLEGLSDLYRGVHVLVLPDEHVPPLRSASDEAQVRIDADGRVVERPWED